jgi:hypothetical protein
VLKQERRDERCKGAWVHGSRILPCTLRRGAQH